MDSKTSMRGRWLSVAGVLVGLFGACSGEGDGEPVSEHGGEGPGAGTGGEGLAGDGGRRSSGGSSAGSPPQGDGGTAGASPRNDGGAAGCSFEDQCGGCEPGRPIVKCSWGDIPLPEETPEDERCAVAAQLDHAGLGGAGAGGTGAGGQTSSGGVAGASTGLCEKYVAPGTWITSCGGCTETDSEQKAGECILRDECCVLVIQQGCGA